MTNNAVLTVPPHGVGGTSEADVRWLCLAACTLLRDLLGTIGSVETQKRGVTAPHFARRGVRRDRRSVSSGLAVSQLGTAARAVSLLFTQNVERFCGLVDGVRLAILAVAASNRTSQDPNVTDRWQGLPGAGAASAKSVRLTGNVAGLIGARESDLQ